MHNRLFSFCAKLKAQMQEKKMKTQRQKVENLLKQTIDEIENAMSNIKTIYGKADGIFVYTFDRSAFEQKTKEDIESAVHDILMKEYSIILESPTIVVNNDCVIAIGYANRIEFMTKKEAEKLC